MAKIKTNVLTPIPPVEHVLTMSTEEVEALFQLLYIVDTGDSKPLTALYKAVSTLAHINKNRHRLADGNGNTVSIRD